MSTPDGAARERPEARPHEAEIIWDGGARRIHAWCTCGWRGPNRLTDGPANEDRTMHLSTVEDRLNDNDARTLAADDLLALADHAKEARHALNRLGDKSYYVPKDEFLLASKEITKVEVHARRLAAALAAVRPTDESTCTECGTPARSFTCTEGVPSWACDQCGTAWDRAVRPTEEPKYDMPPVHINKAGVSSVKASDILNSRAGQEQIRKASHAWERDSGCRCSISQGLGYSHRHRNPECPVHGSPSAVRPADAREPKQAEAIEALRDVVDFAYEQGYHEHGYDIVAAALAAAAPQAGPVAGSHEDLPQRLRQRARTMTKDADTFDLLYESADEIERLDATIDARHPRGGHCDGVMSDMGEEWTYCPLCGGRLPALLAPGEPQRDNGWAEKCDEWADAAEAESSVPRHEVERAVRALQLEHDDYEGAPWFVPAEPGPIECATFGEAVEKWVKLYTGEPQASGPEGYRIVWIDATGQARSVTRSSFALAGSYIRNEGIRGATIYPLPQASAPERIQMANPDLLCEEYWCGCQRQARWIRCEDHGHLDHDTEPLPQASAPRDTCHFEDAGYVPRHWVCKCPMACECRAGAAPQEPDTEGERAE